MDITIAAQTLDGQIYNTQLTLNQADLTLTDSVSETIWAGQHLRELLSYDQSNTVVYQVLNTSMEERVLTKYTAFLALEPGMLTIVDTLSVPTTGIVITNTVIFNDVTSQEPLEEDASDLQINCYPNPASTYTQFSFVLQKKASVLIEIFTLDGQKVTVLIDEEYTAGTHKEHIDVSDLTAGIYFYRVSLNGKNVHTGKFIVMD